MDKNVKEFYVLLATFLVILLLFVVALFLPYETWLHDNSTYSLLTAPNLLLFGGWESIPFIILSVLLFVIHKIKIGVFVLEVGTFSNSVNFFYGIFGNVIGKDLQSYQLGMGFYLYVIYSLLLIVFTVLMHIENRRKDFQDSLSEYKTQKRLRKLKEKRQKEHLKNVFLDKALLTSLKSGKKDLNAEDYKNRIRKEKEDVEELFEARKYEELLRKLQEIYTLSEFFKLKDVRKWLSEKINDFQIISIKKTILDLGTKFDRLNIKEIAERSMFIDKDLIIRVIKNMINNEEIYADYFESSKALVFDKDANMEEIDDLMETFQKWEKAGEKKKI